MCSVTPTHQKKTKPKETGGGAYQSMILYHKTADKKMNSLLCLCVENISAAEPFGDSNSTRKTLVRGSLYKGRTSRFFPPLCREPMRL